jgi:hypothetical protein
MFLCNADFENYSYKGEMEEMKKTNFWQKKRERRIERAFLSSFLLCFPSCKNYRMYVRRTPFYCCFLSFTYFIFLHISNSNSILVHRALFCQKKKKQLPVFSLSFSSGLEFRFARDCRKSLRISSVYNRILLFLSFL